MKKSERYYSAYLEHHCVSRRGLFRGLVNGVQQSIQQSAIKPIDTATLRPPGAIDERMFREQCTECGECAEACPYGMIQMQNGLPELDFSGSYCDECGRCIDACQQKALIKPTPFKTGAQPVLEYHCKNRYTICNICYEQCPYEAIIWQPSQPPNVDLQKCNGCGRCHFYCDGKAWQMKIGG